MQKRKRTSRRIAPKQRQTVQIEVTVDSLGSGGDGVVLTGEEKIFIPFALPTETVQVRLGERRGDGRPGDIVKRISTAAERVAPSCGHFGICGGCSLQHLKRDREILWKREIVADALGKRGLNDVTVDETVAISPGTRRRAVLGWRRTVNGLVLGFKERKTHRLVDISECPLMRPELEDLVASLRVGLLDVLPQGGSGDLLAVLTDSGSDILLDLPTAPDLAGREGLAALADSLDLARLSLRIDGLVEPVAIRRLPVLSLGAAAVALPVGAFLQPSVEGEKAILALIEDGLEGVSRHIADLFCGVGTFSLPLATRFDVSAYDSAAEAVGALTATRRVNAQVRDLFADPLAAGELKNLSAAVFDPPRAGARAQAEALAASGPARVIGVSCNPATFARDARILVDGGYRITRVTPVDQFPWSPHVELVARFDR